MLISHLMLEKEGDSLGMRKKHLTELLIVVLA